MSRKEEREKTVGKLKQTTEERGGRSVVDFYLTEPSNSKIYFEIEIQGKLYNLLFDSGSGISVINHQFIQELGLEIIKTKTITLRLVNGNIVTLDRSVTTSLIFNGRHYIHTFYIITDFKEVAVVGMDFYSKTSLRIVHDETSKKMEDLDGEFTSPSQTFYTRDSVTHLELPVLENARDDGYFVTDKEVRQTFAQIVSEDEDRESRQLLLSNKYLVYLPRISLVNEDKLNGNQDVIMFYFNETSKFDTFEFYIGTRSEPEKAKINELLTKFQHLFAFTASDLRSAKGIKHRIDTGDSTPIRQRNYRYGYKEREEITKQVKEMFKGNIIRESSSSWTNPIVLVKQKEKYRFCLDYRKLNAVTKPDCFPLPLIEDLLDNLEGCPILSIFDLKSGYFQIEVEESDKEKTAFMANNNVYEFNKMPFGLINAPSTFQRFIQDTFKGILHKFVSVYIDDIIVFSKSFDEHFCHLKEVFKRLDERDLRLHPEKCKFLCDELKFLGFIVGREGIKPDPDRTKAINQFPMPTKIKDIRSFIGMANYYRKYIKNFALIAKPLTSLLRKDHKWDWNENCQNSFDTIKSILTNPPLLAHFKQGDPLILYTDASGYGIGAILSQVQEDKERILQFASCTLNKHQENYSVTEKECLGIVWAINKFRHYLIGVDFTVKTDHCGLCWLMSVKDPSGKLARWSLRLQEFRFKIQYKNGKSHGNVDFLSRYPLNGDSQNCDDIPMYLSEEIDIKSEQEKDSWCRYIKDRKERKVLKQNEVYVLENDILYRKIYDSKGIERQLLCLPSSLRKEVLFALHNDITAAHLGFIKTLYKVKERFYFPRMEKYVRKYVRSCNDCQSRKRDTGLPKGELQTIIAEEPFEIVGMDILGPLPKTSRDNKYIIILVDHFTKFVEAEPIPDMTSETVAEFFIESGILRHGTIKKCITDRAQNFCSIFTEAVFQAMSTKHIRTTAYHPQTNGLAERQCKTLTDMLAMYCRTSQRDWDKFVPYLVFAYNTARQDTTKTSPFYLVFGREPRLPIDITMNLPVTFNKIDDNRVRFEEARVLVKQSIIDAKRRQKINYDKKHRRVDFRIGQKVLVYTKTRKIGMSEKLFNNFWGPLKVIDRLSKVTYLLRDLRTEKETKVHVDRIKDFYDDDLEVNDEDVWNMGKEDLTTFSDEFRKTETIENIEEDDQEVE